MEKINLLFTSNENYEEWEKQKSNWSQTIKDLNIDEIIVYLERLNSDFPSEYLYKPCLNINDANYRLSIMEEILLDNELQLKLTNYSSDLKVLKQKLIEFRNEENQTQAQYRYLKIVCKYFSYVQGMYELLNNVKSEGLMSLHNYCVLMSTDSKYVQLSKLAEKLLLDIEGMLANNILINDPANKILTLEKGEEDLNETEQLKSIVYKIFDITINNKYSIVDPAPFSNIEIKILNELITKNDSLFENLRLFYDEAIKLLSSIESFSSLYEQIQFYLTYISFLNSLLKEKASITMPLFNDDKYIVEDCACVSLITKFLESENSLDTVVTNKVDLPKGKMFLLSGPNQGGKTIYLKTVGQIAYLAKCGCFVTSKNCIVPFYDYIGTHFMQNEVLGKGRLIEEVERIEKLLPIINENTLMLLNESFTSTRRKDGVQIAVYYLKKLEESGCSVGFVSHYYEIPEIFNSDIIISLSSGIDKEGRRTYKVKEFSSNGMAYAKDIAYKCGMTYAQIRSEIEVLSDEDN